MTTTPVRACQSILAAAATAAVLAFGSAARAAEVSVVDALENAFIRACDEVSPAVVRVSAEVKKLQRDEGSLFNRPDPFEDFSRKFFGEKDREFNYPLGVGSGVGCCEEAHRRMSST